MCRTLRTITLTLPERFPHRSEPPISPFPGHICLGLVLLARRGRDCLCGLSPALATLTPAVARALLHLGQALIGGMFFSSSASPSAHALLELFPGTHRALVGLPGDHRCMAREFEELNREFRAMYKQQESLMELLEDVSRTIRRLNGEGRDERSTSPVTTVGRSGHFQGDCYSGCGWGGRGHRDGRGLRGVYY